MKIHLKQISKVHPELESTLEHAGYIAFHTGSHKELQNILKYGIANPTILKTAQPLIFNQRLVQRYRIEYFGSTLTPQRRNPIPNSRI